MCTQKRHQGFVCTEKRPCQDTVNWWPSASPRDRPLKQPNLPTLYSFILFKLSNFWYFVRGALANTQRLFRNVLLSFQIFWNFLTTFLLLIFHWSPLGSESIFCVTGVHLGLWEEFHSPARHGVTTAVSSSSVEENRVCIHVLWGVFYTFHLSPVC